MNYGDDISKMGSKAITQASIMDNLQQLQKELEFAINNNQVAEVEAIQRKDIDEVGLLQHEKVNLQMRKTNIDFQLKQMQRAAVRKQFYNTMKRKPSFQSFTAWIWTCVVSSSVGEYVHYHMSLIIYAIAMLNYAHEILQNYNAFAIFCAACCLLSETQTPYKMLEIILLLSRGIGFYGAISKMLTSQFVVIQLFALVLIFLMSCFYSFCWAITKK